MISLTSGVFQKLGENLSLESSQGKQPVPESRPRRLEQTGSSGYERKQDAKGLEREIDARVFFRDEKHEARDFRCFRVCLYFCR